MNELVHSVKAEPAAKFEKTSKLASRAPRTSPSRTNDPARTMAGIMEVAYAEFAEKGLSGARIDEIAAATKTSKRMIYYYFGSK